MIKWVDNWIHDWVQAHSNLYGGVIMGVQSAAGEHETTNAREFTKQEIIAANVEAILQAMGLDLTDPSIERTPQRVADFLMEFINEHDYEEILGGGFRAEQSDGASVHSMVVQSNIPFRMLCEHHLLPALGNAAIGYVPEDRVIGLSKLTRLVDAVGTERPGLQEAITDRIADLLNGHLRPKGTMVVISAEHSCMACRGVNVPNVITTTSAVRGVFRDVPQARAEFFELIRQTKGR